jgi:chorismate mutase / prephenate dehydratase
MLVSFQGENGAYSESAVIQHFGKNAKTIPCKSFPDAFHAVETGKADFGMLPVENSIEGTVTQVCDLLVHSNLKIIGEEIVRVHHCLIANKGSKISQIKKVYSHPQALGQCRKFIEEHKFEAVATYDTAGSVKLLSESREPNTGAIASERAAQIYDMRILAKGVETNKKNYTRFVVLSRKDVLSSKNKKTSITFVAKHKPGTLYEILKIFAQGKINLTKIESRPILGKLWRYNFFIDFEGDTKEKRVKDALSLLKRKTISYKVLGSYPIAKGNYK